MVPGIQELFGRYVSIPNPQFTSHNPLILASDEDSGRGGISYLSGFDIAGETCRLSLYKCKLLRTTPSQGVPPGGTEREVIARPDKVYHLCGGPGTGDSATLWHFSRKKLSVFRILLSSGN